VNIRYVYRVVAEANETSFGVSDEVAILMTDAGGESASTPPAAPDGFAIAGLSVAPAFAKVRVRWTDRSSVEAGYGVEVRRPEEAPLGFDCVATLTPNATDFEVPGLAAETDYELRVRVFNRSGVAYSNIAPVKTPPIAAPTATADLALAILPPPPLCLSCGSRLDLTFSDASANEDGFELEVSRDTLAFSPAGQSLPAHLGDGALTFRVSLRSDDPGPYDYRVCLCNALGRSCTNVVSYGRGEPPPVLP
jgi:hypothetical protein